MDPCSLQALYLDLCKPAKILTESDRLALPRLAGAIREFLWRKAKRLVTESVDVLVLVSYQSDATSHVCKSVAIADASESHVIRCGRVLAEFLVERGYLKVRSFAGREKVAFLVQAPRPLFLGKSCYHGCVRIPTNLATMGSSEHLGRPCLVRPSSVQLDGEQAARARRALLCGVPVQR